MNFSHKSKGFEPEEKLLGRTILPQGETRNTALTQTEDKAVGCGEREADRK